MRVRHRVGRLLAGGLRFRGNPWSWLAGQLGLAAVLGLAASVVATNVLAMSQWQVPFGQLWLLTTAVLLLQWLLRRVDEPSPPAEVTPAELAPPAASGRPYPGAERWERRLSTTNADPEWYARVVRDRLVGLVGERLRQRHGVAMATDPERARVVIGEELYQFLTAPLTRTPSPSELSRLVARMEEI